MKLDVYVAQHNASNSEMAYFIGARSCNHGSGVWVLYKRTTYSGKFTLVHAVCTPDHDPSWRGHSDQDITGPQCTGTLGT